MDNFVGWCLIPPHVLSRDDLTPSQKLLMGRILGLLTGDGYCFASNKWLGDQIGLTKNRVSHLLADLRDKGLVRIELIRDENNKIIKREIYPLLLKKYIPIVENNKRGIVEKVEDSNRDKSNRVENIYNRSKKRKLRELTPVNEVFCEDKPSSGNSSIAKHKKFSSLKDITPEVINEIASHYNVPVGFVNLQFEKMKNWLEAKGRRYKNYKRALQNWVLKAIEDQVTKRRLNGTREAADFSDIA